MTAIGAIGSNLKILKGGNLRSYADKIGFLRSPSRTNKAKMMFVKAGAPATNTAADCPGRLGAIVYDSTNDDVYVCSAYTSASVFTMAKIVD